MRERYAVRDVEFEEVKPFILDIHYAKRIPQIIFRYGLFEYSELVGIITYGKPVNYRICETVCGIENKDLVYELNRLVLKNNKYNEASLLISKSFKLLPKPLIILSYADSSQNHLGTIYKATNFYYIGKTEPKLDKINKGHHRHLDGGNIIRKRRAIKYRYIYFIGSKKQKKYLLNNLTYKIESYPQ